MNNEGSTILVTGATGTVGSEVVRQLSAKGQIGIRAAARSANNPTFKDLKSVEIVELDYNKPETLATAFKNVNKLFLLTPFQSDMLDLTSSLVNAAKKSGIKYIIKQSVMGADAEPGITPGRLHRQAEKIIEESGIPFSFLRPNFFMQNFVNFNSPTIKSQGALYAPAGDGKVSFVDVRDIAAVAVQALINDNQHKGKPFNITGPEALSYGQAAEILSRELGKEIKYVNIPDEDARKGMKDMGMDDWSANSLIDLFDITRKGYASDISSVVEELTGRKPISFSQFVKDYAQAFR
jgi:uncharacterized protein YbjT (DUF2867 family)